MNAELEVLLDAIADAITARVAERLPKAAPVAVRAKDEPARWLTQKEAADYLGVTVKALQGWRSKGEGPAAVKITRRALRYAREDLDRFMRERGQG